MQQEDSPTAPRAGGRATLIRALGLGRRAWLLPLDSLFRTLGLQYRWLKVLFDHAPSVVLETIGKRRAEYAAWDAIHRVPALADYAHLAETAASSAPPFRILERIPETDKRSYIDRYPLASRCTDGVIPYAGTTIDESSGSTGVPYNWIRSARERHVAHRNISFFARYCFGPEPLITINAFSMGAWATGFNMSLALNRNGIVKSTGPEVDKILSTLRFLGPDKRYLICGYPPFLKHLIDRGNAESFPWDTYRMHALLGGEGMSEELRDYLLMWFESAYSGYGATDIEIGMAGESPASVALRRVARARPEIRRALFGDDHRLPMVFQYNPLIHFLETNEDGEIVCTISRRDVLAPRIRYNVHDEGGIMSYREAERALLRQGVALAELWRQPDVMGPRGPLPWTRPVRLPFLWIYGRKDATISVMGANVYPEDVERLIYADPNLAALTHSFCLSLGTGSTGTPRPEISLELEVDSRAQELNPDRIAEQLREGLADLDLDFREAVSEYPEAMLPIVSVYPRGTGPFAEDAGHIKQRRIVLPTK